MTLQEHQIVIDAADLRRQGVIVGRFAGGPFVVEFPGAVVEVLPAERLVPVVGTVSGGWLDGTPVVGVGARALGAGSDVRVVER